MTAETVVQGSESAFPKAEYDARVAKARTALAAAGLAAMVVTGPENIFYLTGQQTPGYYMFQALVLPVEGDPVFIIRQLEYFNFIANTFIADAAIYQDSEDPIAFLTKVLADKGLQGKRVAIDKRGWFLPIVAYEVDAARHWAPSATRRASSRACAWSNRRWSWTSSNAPQPMSTPACNAGAAAVRPAIPRTIWSPR